MGVAFGPFAPSDQYDRDQHANIIEGDYVGDRGQSFLVCADQHGRINSAAISIADYADALEERELTVFFRDGGEFEAFFSEHDDYKAYFPPSD
ncbi:hypothetical protein SH591_02845 [Sphingomonas sp. LY54]|uniref:hypothetical protein n=1 Tax=Sphingomonas sp. LY54 TaxID=3095343 RepID=UPI002D765436|nr:hypothetical protein [Sphingomonas sp. LY54]WRP29136.1 hypothetical protein SH591_02845 [Sphingomonas sp. LY54]